MPGATPVAPEIRIERGTTRARVVTRKIAGHVANPGDIVARASRGEHGGGETPAQRGGVEEDRRARAILTTHQSIGMDQRTSW